MKRRPMMIGAWTFLLSMGLALMLTQEGNAREQCPPGCGMQKRTCVSSARIDKLVCKRNCRATVAPTELRGCVRACADTFRGAKDGCNTDHDGCLDTCNPPSPPSPDGAACLGTCGQALGQCARGVASGAAGCVRGCVTAPGPLTCLQGCAATAQAGAQTCASDLRGCVSSCGAGSPSGAFLD